MVAGQVSRVICGCLSKCKINFQFSSLKRRLLLESQIVFGAGGAVRRGRTKQETRNTKQETRNPCNRQTRQRLIFCVLHVLRVLNVLHVLHVVDVVDVALRVRHGNNSDYEKSIKINLQFVDNGRTQCHEECQQSSSVTFVDYSIS